MERGTHLMGGTCQALVLVFFKGNYQKIVFVHSVCFLFCPCQCPLTGFFYFSSFPFTYLYTMSVDKEKIEALREDYRSKTLDRTDLNPNAIAQFKSWFDEALQSNILEANAMTLATVSPDGKPAARIVLLKSIEDNGFVFYTNYESRKGKEMDATGYAALVFCWLELERQIRIEGKVEKISRAASLRYFKSRPKGSQIGAWVSPQSTVIENRSILENRKKELEAKYKEEESLPIPPHWGGYIVIPEKIEFWQGRTSRLHDRFCYTRQESGDWQIDRLAP